MNHPRSIPGHVYRHRVPLSRDGSGNVVYTFIAYSLDQAGRTVAVDNPSPEVDSTLSYDDDGRLSSAVGPDGTSSWTRDLAGRTTQLAQPGGTLTYAYDAAGRLDTLAQAGRGTFDWAYDAYGRVSSLTDPEGKVTGLEYDTAGRPWRRTLGNGLKEERGWDTRGRLSSFALKSAGGATLRSESWGYSSRSDVLSHTVDVGATAYTYDDEGQLFSESRTGYATSYTYDGNGNRKTRVVNGSTETYSYDVGDKLTGIAYSGGGSRSFSYDLAGRMLTDSFNSSAFSWTADSRLVSLTASTGNETYTYSSFGTRAKVGTRTFLRAGAGVTASVLADGNASYTPGVSEVRSSVTTYSHSGLKSMAAQTDAAATPAVQATRTYDAFGAKQSSTGTWQGPFGTAGAFGYQSPQTGNEQGGLHLLGHRYYDASTGRFLTRDPIGDGSNWYAYCANDPISRFDADGAQWRDLNEWGRDMEAGIPRLIKDTPRLLDEWWNGVPRVDGNGNNVRVGGKKRWWNPPGNAVTFNCEIHLADEGTWNDYRVNDKWQDHEEAHSVQGMNSLMLLEYYHGWQVGIVREVVFRAPTKTGILGHDNNPFEVWADEYADYKGRLRSPSRRALREGSW